jgi:hypothetical protein
MSSPTVIMAEAMETFRKRNKLYGDNYLKFGKVMTALFPAGWALETEEDWNRFGVIIQIVSKLTRYIADPQKGQLDSIHDMGVYCFMLEDIDGKALCVQGIHDLGNVGLCKRCFYDPNARKANK